MRIELDLPDWVDEKHIYVLAGVECVARRLTNTRYWEVKTSRCNMCGECCKHLSRHWPRGARLVDGKWTCDHLTYRANEYLCDYGRHRPYECCVADHADKDYCNVVWERIDAD